MHNLPIGAISVTIDVNEKHSIVWEWNGELQKGRNYRLVNLVDNKIVCRLESGDPDWIVFANVLREGRLLTGSRDKKTFRLWDINSGVCDVVFIGHEDSISYAVELDNGDFLSWALDKTYRLWDKFGTQKSVIRLQGTDDCQHIVKQEFNCLITWQCNTGRIGIWDLYAGKLKYERHHATDDFLPGLFESYGPYFISYDRRSQTAVVWNFDTGKRVGEVKGKFDGACAYSEQLTLAWYSNYQSTIELTLIDIEICSYDRFVELNGARINKVRVLADGRILVWLNDFRLIVLDYKLQVLAELAQPTVTGSGYCQVIGSFFSDFSDAELSEFIEKPGSYNVHYYNANPIAGSFQAQRARFETVQTGGIDCFRAAIPTKDRSVLMLSCADGFYVLEVDDNAIHPVNNWNDINFSSAELSSTEYCTPTAVIAKPNNPGTLSSKEGAPFIKEDSMIYQGHRMRLTKDKKLLVWDLNDCKSLLLCEIKGTQLTEKISLLNQNSGDTFTLRHPIVAPDGRLFNFYNGHLRPLCDPGTGVAISVDPINSHCDTHSHWAQNDHVAFWQDEDLLFVDASTGELIAAFPSPFGGGGRTFGVTLVNQQRWLAWRGLEFASWDMATLKPLYRLKDPANDSPHYHQYWPLRNGGIAYAGGQYSCDTRIVLWDGAKDIRVVHCHPNEVGGLVQLEENSFLSWTVERDISMVKWSLDDQWKYEAL